MPQRTVRPIVGTRSPDQALERRGQPRRNVTERMDVWGRTDVVADIRPPM
jgi:hypothetical protein